MINQVNSKQALRAKILMDLKNLQADYYNNLRKAQIALHNGDDMMYEVYRDAAATLCHELEDKNGMYRARFC
jgi:hypothetical protein